LLIGLSLVSILGYVNGQGVWDYVVQLTTSVTEDPRLFHFNGSYTGRFSHFVYRKSPEATAWGNAIATLPATATEFTDNNVDIGIDTNTNIKVRHTYIRQYFDGNSMEMPG
jgi:hypothetical protein